jgi:HK97 family phage prohead protease
MEKRTSTLPEARAKIVNLESRTIKGYGIVFNKESVDLRANGRVFREVIRPEAVKGVPLDNLLSMHNHRSERLLGTTASGTMRTGVDDIGVWYEVDLPDAPTGQDVFESVRRGDTPGSSFQFDIRSDGDKWSMKDGKAFREVVQFNGIYEMGPVSEPAYPDTSISARSLESLEALEAEQRDYFDQSNAIANSASFISQANWIINDCKYRLKRIDDLKKEVPELADLYEKIRGNCTEVITALKAMIATDAEMIATANEQREENTGSDADHAYKNLLLSI